jgi:hypothetical protein
MMSFQTLVFSIIIVLLAKRLTHLPFDILPVEPFPPMPFVSRVELTAEIIYREQIEDILFDSDGNIWGGRPTGEIVIIEKNGPTSFAPPRVTNRFSGFIITMKQNDGITYALDAYNGLYSFEHLDSKTGISNIKLLTTEANGTSYVFLNNFDFILISIVCILCVIPLVVF